ncbi:hypothetical protein EJB05_35117, partial [Eragrostis curvula]
MDREQQLNRDSVRLPLPTQRRPGYKHTLRILPLAHRHPGSRSGYQHRRAEWVLQKTVDLDKLVFPLLHTASSSVREVHLPRIVDYDEDNHMIHIAVNTSVFTVNLETVQYTKVLDGRWIDWYYPYTRFYTLGNYHFSLNSELKCSTNPFVNTCPNA